MKKILRTLLIMLLVIAFMLMLAGCSFPTAQAMNEQGVTVGGDTPAQVAADFLGAALRLVLLGVLCVFTKIVFPFIRNTVIPYLEDKHLMNIVRVCVGSAEKQGETGAIAKENKKAYVISLLRKKGIPITPMVKEMIESAVEELDLLGLQFNDLIMGDAIQIPPEQGETEETDFHPLAAELVGNDNSPRQEQQRGPDNPPSGGSAAQDD